MDYESLSLPDCCQVGDRFLCGGGVSMAGTLGSEGRKDSLLLGLSDLLLTSIFPALFVDFRLAR